MLLRTFQTTNLVSTSTVSNIHKMNFWKVVRKTPVRSASLATNYTDSTTQKLRFHCPNTTDDEKEFLKPGILSSQHSHRYQKRQFHTNSHLQCFASSRISSPIAPTKSANYPNMANETIQDNGMVAGDSFQVHSMQDTVKDDCSVFDELCNEQFTNYRLAYGNKTTFELARMSFFYFIFKYEMLTNHSEKIMELVQRLLGKRISDAVLKKTIYNQYVAGETNEEIKHAITRLQKEGVGPLIAVPIEDDLGHSTCQYHDKEEILDQNCDKILKCLQLCLDVDCSRPMFQLRMTALFSPELIKKVSDACLVNEKGDSDAISVAALDALVQGIQGKTMDLPKTKEWEEVMAHRQEFENVLRRLQAITERISETDIVAMVDAECTYFNPAIRHLTFAMKEICNKDKPLVFYTYQAYLKKAHNYLKSDLNLAQARGICFGAKLVRGAYIIKERSRAKLEGYPDPINENMEATTNNYKRCLSELLSNACENEARTKFIIATHNEESVRYAFERMRSLGLSFDSKSILFGQLYGMADHVSYTLGKKGCNVVKSLPYGSVNDTVPYLARRAIENRSIFDNVRKEKALVKKALQQRLLRKC